MFESATVSTTAHVTIDTATNDNAGASDLITTTAGALLAVPNTGFTFLTGPNVAGNIFNLDAQGRDVVLDQNHITVAGAQPILFDTLGTIELTNPGNITVVGASSDDALVVTATGTSAGGLRLNNGPLVQFNTLLSLTFTGNAGGDALTIHNPSGTIFAPAGGVRFDGGDQSASLTLSGGGAMPFAENYSTGPASWAGNIVFIGPAATAITFTGVAHITDTVTSGTYSVNATDVANTITLDDGAVKGDGQARLTIDSFPVVEFADKTNLILNAGLTDADQGNTIFVNAHEVPSGLITAIVNGGAGNDVIRVFSSPAGVATTVNGGAGDDLIAVQSDLTVPLSIFGGPGNDTIYGGAGNSLIDGGTGNNTIRAQGGNATIDSNGTDLVYTGDGQVTVNGGAGSETVFGGAGNDLINGDQGFNFIHAGDGNTTVIGGPSGNTIYGGAGNDILQGGAGSDTIYGGPGTDQLFGDAGDDTLYAGSGKTSIYGGAGDDLIFGGPAANLLDGGAGNNTIVAGTGAEILQAGDGDNTFQGGPLTVSMTVGSGNNVLLGGSGTGGYVHSRRGQRHDRRPGGGRGRDQRPGNPASLGPGRPQHHHRRERQRHPRRRARRP